MTAVILVALALVAVAGTLVALTSDVFRQILLLSFLGLQLALLFFVLQAPDAALSQFAVGTVVLPAVLLVTLAKVSPKSR